MYNRKEYEVKLLAFGLYGYLLACFWMWIEGYWESIGQTNGNGEVIFVGLFVSIIFLAWCQEMNNKWKKKKLDTFIQKANEDTSGDDD